MANSGYRWRLGCVCVWTAQGKKPALRGPDLFSFWSMVSLIYFEAYRSLMKAMFSLAEEHGLWV